MCTVCYDYKYLPSSPPPTSLGKVPINVFMSSLFYIPLHLDHSTFMCVSMWSSIGPYSPSSISDQLPLTHLSCLVLCRPLWLHECGSRAYPEESISNTPLHLPVMTFFCSLFHNIPLALARIYYRCLIGGWVLMVTYSYYPTHLRICI